MKKLIVLTFFLITGMGAFAQRPQREMPSPEKRAEMMTERMAKQLELSEAQKQQVYAIHLEYAQKRQVEMEARRETMEKRREAMKSEIKEQETRINGVLSKEQQEKWETIRMENREKMRERRPRGKDGNRPRQPLRRRGN